MIHPQIKWEKHQVCNEMPVSSFPFGMARNVRLEMGCILADVHTLDLWSHRTRMGKVSLSLDQTNKVDVHMLVVPQCFTWISSYLFVVVCFLYLSRLYPYLAVSFGHFWIPPMTQRLAADDLFFLYWLCCASSLTYILKLDVAVLSPYRLDSVKAGSESSRFMVSSFRPGKLHVLWCCTAARQEGRARKIRISEQGLFFRSNQGTSKMSSATPVSFVTAVPSRSRWRWTMCPHPARPARRVHRRRVHRRQPWQCDPAQPRDPCTAQTLAWLMPQASKQALRNGVNDSCGLFVDIVYPCVSWCQMFSLQ